MMILRVCISRISVQKPMIIKWVLELIMTLKGENIIYLVASNTHIRLCVGVGLDVGSQI